MKRRRLLFYVVVFCALVTVVLGVLVKKTFPFPKTPYYAVFLSNGQVYFGHLRQKGSSILILRNVYYFRTDTNLSNDALKQANETDLRVSLIKLGNEIHEPEDIMFINREQVLFWEQLRSDSALVDAMEKKK